MNPASGAMVVPYCGPAPAPADLWSGWNLDPALLAVLGLVALAGSIGTGRAGRSQRGAFMFGWVMLAVAFVSPLCALASALFSARIAHHLVLVGVAAPALAWVLAAPARRAPPAGLAVAAHVAVFWLWHAPVPYAAALSHDGVYWVMELSLLGTALAFWWAVFARRHDPVAFLTLGLSAMVPMGLLGALLVFAPSPLYADHLATTIPWGLTPLEDQQLAGLVMWVPGSLPWLAVFVAGIAAWFRAGLAAPDRGRA